MSDITWNGSVSTDLSVGGNWIGGVVPTTGDNAFIVNAGNMPATGVLTCDVINFTEAGVNGGEYHATTITVDSGGGLMGNFYFTTLNIGASGYVYSGNYYGAVNNYGYIGGSSLYPKFYGVVYNDSSAYLNDGRFLAQTRGSTGGNVNTFAVTQFSDDVQTWTGASDGDVANGGNWSNFIPPGAGTAIIPNYTGYTNPPTTGTLDCNDVVVGDGVNYGDISCNVNVTGTLHVVFGDLYNITCNGAVVLEAAGQIYGGTYNGSIANGGYIHDYMGTKGTFNGIVTNTNTLEAGVFTAQTRVSTGGIVGSFPVTQFTDDPKLWNGSVSGDVTDAGNWTNGIPSGSVDGYIPSGTSYSPSSGTITTTGTITVVDGASISCNVTGATVDNYGTISGGTFSEVAFYLRYPTSVISGGSFDGTCTVTNGNQGTISNAIFYCAFHNSTDGFINSGTFNGAIVQENGSYINGGIFNAVVDNTSGTINGGNFTVQTRASTGGTVAAFPATVFMGEGSNPGKYWYSTGNTDWDTVGNWWLDISHTSPATDVPDGTIDVVILASAANPIINNVSWVQPNSIDCSVAGLTFTETGSPVSCNITGNPTFNSSAGYQYGTITGSPIFNNSAYGSAYVVGNAEFRGSTNVVGGDISGTATFRNTAQVGTPITVGNCEFYDSSANGDGVTASGNITFHNASENRGIIEAVNLLMLDTSIETGLNDMTLSGWKACNGNSINDGFGKHVIEPRLTTHGGGWLVHQAPSGTV